MDREHRQRLVELIQRPSTPKRFAGKPVPVFHAGDKVRVVQGENVGNVYEVIIVEGNAYAVDKQVYVNVIGDELLWYYPWDLEPA